MAIFRPTTKEYPLTNFRFQVFIEGMPPVGFSSVTGIGSSTQVEERKSLGHLTPKILPAETRYEPLVLRRGLTNLAYVFYLWREKVKMSIASNNTVDKKLRRNAIIRIHEKGRTENPITYKIINCWPSSLIGPELNAIDDNYAQIDMVLQNEGQNPDFPNYHYTYGDIPSELTIGFPYSLPKLRFKP